MELLMNILLITSCFLLIALGIYTSKKLNLAGMQGMFSMIISFLVWIIGNFIEFSASDFNLMLIGRNIEQIGVFFTPLCTLYFSIEYTANKKLLKYSYIITIIQVLSIILIFTDGYHHIMRQSVFVQTNTVWGDSIGVVSTKIGSILVAFNFCIPLIAIVNLLLFMRTISSKLRRPLILIVISMFGTFIVSVLQSTVLNRLNIYIPIPILSLPCILLLTYAVFSDKSIGVTPTALDKVFEVIDQGIIVINEKGEVLEYNKRALQLLDDTKFGEYLKTESGVYELSIFKNSNNGKKFLIDDLPTELKSTKNNRDIALSHHKLEALWGKRAGYVIVLTDITLLKMRAEMDYLTGIYNREGMKNAFSDLCSQNEDEFELSAMIMDVDNFKTINDTYSHFGGDMILKDLAMTVQAFLPGKCVIGRLGGDEFVVLIKAPLNEALVIAENLRECVTQRKVQYLNFKLDYTVSIGVCSCKNDRCNLDDLLYKADLALYNAKHKGKNIIST